MKTHAQIRVAFPLAVVAALASVDGQASPSIEKLVYDVAINGVTDPVRWSEGLLQDRARLGSGFYCEDKGEHEGDEAPRALDIYLGVDISRIETDSSPSFGANVYRPTIGLEYQVSDKLTLGAAYTHTEARYDGPGGFNAEGGADGFSFTVSYETDGGLRFGGTLNYTEGETDYNDPFFGVNGASWETSRGGSVSAGYGRLLGTPGEVGGNFFFDVSGSFLLSHREVILNNGGTMTDFDYSDVFFAGRTQFGTQLSSCCSVYGLMNVFTCVAGENRNALAYPFNGTGGINTVPSEIGTYGEVGAGLNWCINEQFNLNTQIVTSVFNDVFTETRGTLFLNYGF